MTGRPLNLDDIPHGKPHNFANCSLNLTNFWPKTVDPSNVCTFLVFYLSGRVKLKVKVRNLMRHKN